VTGAGPVRAVVVEDSLLQRTYLVSILEAGGGIKVVGTAGEAGEAVRAVERLRPDVVTLDLQIPGGGGLAVIERVMATAATPILVLSSTISRNGCAVAVEAMAAGALEALPKPERWTAGDEAALRGRVRGLRGAHVIRHHRGLTPAPRARLVSFPDVKPALPGTGSPVVGLAASTGGPQALASVLAGLGGLAAAVLVVQHIHADFFAGFVEWMGRDSALPVDVARSGMELRPGIVLLAPPGRHLTVGRGRHGLRVVLDAEPATLHRPSADALFRSLAASAGPSAVGAVLTGMGDDGAQGLLALRGAGGYTIAQDEASSAVYGMPAAAARSGAAQVVATLGALPAQIRLAVRRLAA
jgi:two-component system chemotaxis response regulator CheB